MAVSVSTIWEVRGGSGADTSGGGFVEGAAGTDFSQQNSPQANGTNLTVDATTNTDVAPDGYSPTSIDVGNIIQITAGIGFTTGFYQIASIQSGKWRLDRSPGAITVAGGTWALGGALNTISKAYGAAISLNRIYIKATATYTFTTTVTDTGGKTIEMIGYSATRTDFQSASITGRPTITTATNSTVLFTYTTSSLAIIWRNIILTNTAGTRAACISASGIGLRGAIFDRVKFDGFTTTVSASAYSGALYQRCEVANCTGNTTGAIDTPNNDSNGITLMCCYIHDNAGYGLNTQSSGAVTAIRTIFDTNTLGDIRKYTGGTGTNQQFIHAANCIFYGGGGSGILHSLGSTNDSAMHIMDNIFYGKVRGIYSDNSRVPYFCTGGNNAFGNNSTADRTGMPTLAGDISLSADPFTDAANGDFSLNSAAGGGALLKGAGLPTVIP